VYLIVVVVRIADLSGDLQSCDERAAGRAYAIEEKVTCGPGETARAGGGIDARLGANDTI